MGLFEDLINQLKIITESYQLAMPLQSMKCLVIIPFSVSYPVPIQIKGNSRHNKHICLFWGIPKAPFFREEGSCTLQKNNSSPTTRGKETFLPEFNALSTINPVSTS
jgi:hypothetical protein